MTVDGVTSDRKLFLAKDSFFVQFPETKFYDEAETKSLQKSLFAANKGNKGALPSAAMAFKIGTGVIDHVIVSQDNKAALLVRTVDEGVARDINGRVAPLYSRYQKEAPVASLDESYSQFIASNVIGTVNGKPLESLSAR